MFAIIVDLASGLRLYYAIIQFQSADTWDYYPSFIYAIIELGLGQICVSLPPLRPLVLLYTDRFKSFVGVYGHSTTNDRSRTQHSGTTVVPSESSTEPQSQQHKASRSLDETLIDNSNKPPFDFNSHGINVVHTIELNTVEYDDEEHENMNYYPKFDRV